MSTVTVETPPSQETPEAPSSGALPMPPSVTGASKRGSRLRLVLPPALVLVLLVTGLVGFNVWWQGAHYVSTDNAQVGGQPVQVGSMNAGRVASVHVQVGDSVRQGAVLAVVALPSEVGVAQNGSPKLDFLGAADTQVPVKSPIDGLVIAVPGAVGATVAQGAPIITLVDPTQLWVTANIDETQASRLRIGLEAEVHLDALQATVVGHVAEMTPATASTFALLPQQNTTTNFTKVNQVVPVRIAVELGGKSALLGSSASVKIRVA